MKEPKVLIISQNLPPVVSASSILNHNIFYQYQGQIEAIGGDLLTKIDNDFKLDIRTHYLKPIINNYYIRLFYYKYGLRYRFINKFFMRKLIRKIKPDVIISGFPEIEFLILSYELAKEFGIKYYVHFHDLWEENMRKPYEIKLARKYENKIISYATRVIACTELQKKYLDEKYGINCDVVYHPIPDNEINPKPYEPNRKKTIKIVFLGTLSNLMNFDALKVASHAFSKLPDEYEFLWLPINDIPLDYLINSGFNTDRIKIKVVSRNDLDKELKQADILLAPLSFKNGSMDEINTVFSNKLLKYFVIGKPILVFSPVNSYHTILAKKDGWGYVVDNDSEDDLNNAVKTIINDLDLQRILVENGYKAAEKRRASVESNKVFNWVMEDCKQNL
jgi:glycosyltransferase involved in cell wall biosynthesis